MLGQMVKAMVKANHSARGSAKATAKLNHLAQVREMAKPKVMTTENCLAMQTVKASMKRAG